MQIYLAGSVPKGDKEAQSSIDWRKGYTQELSKYFEKIESLDPNIFSKLEGDSLGVTGADCMSIQDSYLVLVNAERKLGAGTAMELVVAKYLHKPVITVLPRNSHHRRSDIIFGGKVVADWIHPFIDTFSDFIIENIHELGSFIEKLKTAKIKDITIVDEAIRYAQTLLDD